MFNKNALVGLITIVCLTISMSSACHCSSLRLMAMGDMQGIMEDESDYLYDVTALSTLKNSQIYLSSGISNLSNSFPKQTYPHSYDERTSAGGFHNINVALKLSDQIAMYTAYSNMNVNSDISYFTFTGVDLTEKDYDVNTNKKGYFESLEIGLSYKALDWLVLGASSKRGEANFHYSEEADIISGGSGHISNEYDEVIIKDVPGIFTRIFNNNAYLALYYQAGNKTGDVISANGDYQVIPNLLSAHFMSNYTDLYEIPIATQRRQAAGISLKLFKNTTLGFGAAKNWYFVNSDKNVFTSTNAGIEYKIYDDLSVLCGAILKNLPADTNYLETNNLLDLTFGVNYRKADYSFELACVYYQDVPVNMSNFWNTIPPMTGLQSPGDGREHLISGQRNMLILGGLECSF